MKESKLRVCISIDRDLNNEFKAKYNQLMSKYIEVCLQEAVEDSSKLFEKVFKNEKN